MFEARYCIYKKPSKFGCQIAFMIDQIPYSPRRSGIENNYELICKRPLCKIEREEMEANRDNHTRRFVVWYYKDIEFLIAEDLKYNIQTPEIFVNECKKRGLVQKIKVKSQPKQLTLF